MIDSETRTLFSRYRETGDARVREALVTRYLPLARSLARRFAAGTEPLDDLEQVAALALGGRVGPNPTGRTVGLVPVRLTADGAHDPLLTGLGGLLAVHYNDDVVLATPSGATVLATLPDGRPQALRLGPAAWGVQFHPETSPEIFGAWLRWDSPDGLTADQEELLAGVMAARDDLRAAWQPLAERFASMVVADAVERRASPVTS